ncbi:hypothetical protein CC86DRAFT_180744 [Ophiobolus disseminans]|uniref:Uncharacterized protein n=1 Tax=Ophiobolus disseminans TaxID=1469910 RepID=A0A6A7ABS1_9PLEO|nr:hypothetical protein CC86DRAFT_180744 [Ophiobolus disseminans]
MTLFIHHARCYRSSYTCLPHYFLVQTANKLLSVPPRNLVFLTNIFQLLMGDPSSRDRVRGELSASSRAYSSASPCIYSSNSPSVYSPYSSSVYSDDSSLYYTDYSELARRFPAISFPSTTVPATVLDLNGNSVRPGNPTPVLRRSSLGHLFQPRNGVVKAVEMMDPVPVTQDEIVHRQQNFPKIAGPPKEVRVIKKEERRGTKPAMKRKRVETKNCTTNNDIESRASLDKYISLTTLIDEQCAKPPPEQHDIVAYTYDDVPSTAPLVLKACGSMPSAPPQRRHVARPKVHDCSTEDARHRCMTKELVHFGRPDSDTLEPGTVRIAREL